MEITYHLPISEWYYHDLEYWGLDYPPLTAYVSWLYAWIAHNMGSLHDGAFDNAEIMTNGVCEWDDSVCVDRMMQKSNTGKKPSSKGLGVLKDLVALHSSRWGFEDSRGKLYMRFTVLLSDFLIYMSAVWVLVARLTKEEDDGAKQNNSTGQDSTTSANNNKLDDPIIPISQRPRVWLLLTALSQPALILIDHGHFQYNTISLGLALWSFHFMTLDTTTDPSKSNRSSFVGPILGSILFSLALNFKQMELYHAPAIFAYLLGRCFRQHDKHNKQSVSSMEAAGRFCMLGITVILTFSIFWLPFAIFPRNASTSLSSTFHLDGVIQIIKRLFPFQRGVFEGKVANLWCALSIKPFSIRDRVPNELLPLLALGLTLILILPPCWMLFRVGKGDNFDRDIGSNGDKPSLNSSQTQNIKGDSEIRLLLWGAASTSLAFFLASFQVHEKGIIIPLAPISLLAMNAPHFVSFFSIVATWSLWPLLAIDQLLDPYVCCLVIFMCINSMAGVPPSQMPSYKKEVDIFSDKYITKYIPTLSGVVMVLLHLSELMIAPPSHLPDLFPVLWSFVGCGLFCISYLGTVWAMASQSKSRETRGEMQAVRGKRAKSKSIIPPAILGMLLLSYTKGSAAFLLCSSCHHSNIRIAYTLQLSSGNHDMDGIITHELLERARLPLGWELQNAKEAKPVLDLSARNYDTLSLADGADEFMSPVEDATVIDDLNQVDCEPWENGELWEDTAQNLIAMGILANNEGTGTKLTSQKILNKAPQLLRLPTSQIVEAASFLLSYPFGTNSTALLVTDPSLLTYWADDLEYGLDIYLSNMMFRGNSTLAAQMIQTQLSFSPAMALQLVRMGIEGGMSERSVSRALGDAGKASSKAVEGVVGDSARSLREWKQNKGGKGSLG